MTRPGRRVDPVGVVAEALGCSPTALSIESAMYRDHGWDSFGHISVILALEKAFGTTIPPEEVVNLTTMKAILSFSERLQGVDESGV